MMKMKKALLVVIVLLSIVVISGCTIEQPKPTSQEIERQNIEDNQKTLQKSTQIPKLQESLERENIARRLELTNTKNKIFYVYLISNGKVMAYFTTTKISSVNSFLVTQEQIVRDPYCYSGSGTSCGIPVEAPDLDGTYGSNGEDGRFTFTTDGHYLEWRGDYIVSDYPFTLTTPPEINVIMDKNGK